LKVHSLVVVICKSIVQIITDTQNTVLSLSIYTKQFLNKVNKFNKLLKLLTNNKNYNPR